MLIARSPSSGATSSAINTLVSRIALDTVLPRTREGLIDQVAISVPAGIGATVEQVGDVIPTLPTPWRCGNHSSSETTRDRDLNLFAAFGAPNQFGCVLTQFSESNTRHEMNVAQVLLNSDEGAEGFHPGDHQPRTYTPPDADAPTCVGRRTGVPMGVLLAWYVCAVSVSWSALLAT